ncbi:AAA domain-containing protein [Cronobacter turicensis]|uniref:AAA domain-containing protein n=1 Tax=Cronobacter turicensis TaxID=413502 RepID=UPI001FCF956E|nr:AAA domain-containing protein [Cronobacter turicensis]
MMQNSSRDILSAWRDYIKLSGAEKSKIPASQVHEHQQLMLDEENCEENQNGIVINVKPEISENWRKHFVKYGEKGEITHIEPVNLLFPVLRCIENERGKSHVKYLPLFSFPLPKSFFELGGTTLRVPVKDGQLVSAFPFAFREMFGIQLNELGENRHMMSVVSALTGCKYDTFFEAFEALQTWIAQQPNRKHSLENAFNALLAPLHNEDYNLKRDAEDFTWLCDKSTGDFPLLEQYLNHIHNDENAWQPDEVVTCGLFETQYPLGHGQMAAIQAINQDERLIAVQGAPGTGKTTLFKSLIAQQLVARALAIADGKDQNFGMLVTSTAIKAVENIIDDLRSDPATQALDWLWFHSGSNEQVQHELTRLEQLISRWRQESYDEQRQHDFLAVLHKHRDELNTCNRAYQNEKAAVVQAITDCDLDTANAEALTAQYLLKIPPVAAQAQLLGLDVSLQHPDDLKNLLRQLEQHLLEIREIKAQRLQARKIYQTLQATWPQQHNLEQILHWMESPLRPALELHYRDYPRKGIKRHLVRLFEGKYQTRLQQMNLAVPDDFHYFRLSSFSHHQLATLADAGEILSRQPENLILLAKLLHEEPDVQQEETLMSLCRHVEMLQEQWRRVILAQHVMAQHQMHYPEGNWCGILRKRFISQHREMFEAAIGYLWQEQLKRKNELEEVLTHWRALMSNRRSAGYYRWLDKMDEFYRALSLVYPVMATTLVSAWKVAGYRKLDELKGHKPWHLALCDEAGMISLESLVPLLSRSEKAMIVGDPLQIEPIRSLSENLQTQLRERHFASNNSLYERVSPASVTGWHRAAGTLSGRVDDIGSGIILDEHRRCQKPIADLFIRLAGYHGVSVETAAPSKRIASAFEKSGGHHLMFYSVEGQKGDRVNTNQDEVDAIELLLNKLEEAGYDLTTDVGIVTPYSNQKSLLIQRFAQRMNHWQKNCIGTVHQFQGVGFEVIIYSPVIFHPLDNPNFQNATPNMLNVAVSRAKQQFIVVGNYHRLRQAGGYLKVLADSVAEDFLLEQGSQHPNFASLSQTPRLQRYYRDCEHIAAFSALAAQCEQELIIITPWIRRGGKAYQRPELAQLVATQRRGINVKVYYGYYHQHLDRPEDNDEQLVAEYKEKLGKENVIRLKEGTHEKVLMIDGRYIVLGSWNWLSHGYHNSCEGSEQFSNAIRHEISAELDDVSLVKELRERLKLE